MPADSHVVIVNEVPKPDQVIEWMDDILGFINTEAYSNS